MDADYKLLQDSFNDFASTISKECIRRNRERSDCSLQLSSLGNDVYSIKEHIKVLKDSLDDIKQIQQLIPDSSHGKRFSTLDKRRVMCKNELPSLGRQELYERMKPGGYKSQIDPITVQTFMNDKEKGAKRYFRFKKDSKLKTTERESKLKFWKNNELSPNAVYGGTIDYRKNRNSNLSNSDFL